MALGAAGERGVDHVLQLLDADVRRTMALLGAPTIADLDRDRRVDRLVSQPDAATVAEQPAEDLARR